MVADPIVSVGMARDVAAIARGRKVRLVAESADEQTRIPIFGDEQLAITSLCRALYGKDIAGILQAEAVARVIIGQPIVRQTATCRQLYHQQPARRSAEAQGEHGVNPLPHGVPVAAAPKWV